MPDFGRWNSDGGDPSLNEVNRSDQFLDALASQQPTYPTDHDEAELANLLAGWRDEVRETPASELVTTDEAARMLDHGSVGRRRRFSLAVVGSAAAAVLCLGGFGAVVSGAGPGDALYGLRTMLFGEQATRDDAVILAAQTEMAQVQQLIDQGDWQAAQDKLETITTTVATVNDFERKEELVTQWQELTVKVDAQDAAATVAPGAPLPTFPDIPVANLDPATLITPPSELQVILETTRPSGTTGPSGTTAASEAATASETASPSGTTAASGTTATSEAAAAAETDSPAETTAPSEVDAASETASPSGTTAASEAASPSPTSSAVTTAPSSSASPTTTRSPATATTSTSVAAPSSASAPSSSPATAVPSPTATSAPAPVTTNDAPAAPSSTPALLPTTTTLIEAP